MPVQALWNQVSPNRVLVLACALLALSVSTSSGTHEVQMSTFLYVEEDGDSVRVLGISEGGTVYEIVRLTNYSLPTTECGPNFIHCELQCFSCTEGGDDKCCTFPVVGEEGGNELALFHIQWSVEESGSSSSLQLQGLATIAHNQDCVTAHTYVLPSGQHYVDCINTTAGDNAYFLLFSLHYDVADIAATSTDNLVQEKFVRFSDFTGPLSLSDTLYVQPSNGDGCPALQNIFFVADNTGYTFGVEEDRIKFINKWEIGDCEIPRDIGYLLTAQNGLLLRVQCSKYTTKLFTLCTNQAVVATYDSRINGTLYQCVKDTLRANLTLQHDYINITTSGSLQEFGVTEESHDFPFLGNISYAFCNIGSDVSFVFGHHNGSILSLSFTSGKISTIARNACDNLTETYTREHCYKARMTNTRDLIMTYDYHDAKLKVANLSCPESPVVESTLLHPKPPMATFLLDSERTYECRNNSIDVGTSSIVSNSTVHRSLTATPTTVAQSRTVTSSPVMISSTLTSEMSISPESTPTSSLPTRSKPQSLKLLPLLVLLIVPVIIIVVIVIICCKKPWIQQESIKVEHQLNPVTTVTTTYTTITNSTSSCVDCTGGKTDSKESSPSAGAATSLSGSGDNLLQQNNMSTGSNKSDDAEQPTTPDASPPLSRKHDLPSANGVKRSLGANPGLLISVNGRTPPPSSLRDGSSSPQLDHSRQDRATDSVSAQQPAHVPDSPSLAPEQPAAVSSAASEELRPEQCAQGQDPAQRRERSSAQDSSESRNSRDSGVANHCDNPDYNVNVTPRPAISGGNSAQVPGQICPANLHLPHHLQQHPQQQLDPFTGQPSN